ncbi:hypothetical protein ACJJTC_008053 [Scirpophaga incertulas]
MRRSTGRRLHFLTAPPTIIYNKSVSSGTFPSAWKEARIVPILNRLRKVLHNFSLWAKQMAGKGMGHAAHTVLLLRPPFPAPFAVPRSLCVRSERQLAPARAAGSRSIHQSVTRQHAC